MEQSVKLVLQVGHEAHIRKNGLSDWTAFVRGLKNRIPLRSVIKKVVFSYDHLGEHKEITRSTPPFYIKQKGSEEVNVKIDIQFKGVAETFSYNHMVKLSCKDSKSNAIRKVCEKQFTFKNPSNELSSAVIRCGGYFSDGIKFEKNIESYSAEPLTSIPSQTKFSNAIRQRYLNMERDRKSVAINSLKDLSKFCKKLSTNLASISDKSFKNNDCTEINALREQNKKLKEIILQYDTNKEVFLQEISKLKIDEFFKRHKLISSSLKANNLLKEAQIYIQVDADRINSLMKQGDDDVTMLYNLTTFYISMHDFFEKNANYYIGFGVDRHKILNIHKLSSSSILKTIQ